jgi:hypothetical protein
MAEPSRHFSLVRFFWCQKNGEALLSAFKNEQLRKNEHPQARHNLLPYLTGLTRTTPDTKYFYLQKNKNISP